MIDLTNPTTRYIYRDLLEAQYLARFIKRWEALRAGPIPDLKPFPQPDPLPFSPVDLLGDLVVKALYEKPEPQTNSGSIIDQIRSERLHVEVLKGLQDQLHDGLALVEAELKRAG